MSQDLESDEKMSGFSPSDVILHQNQSYQNQNNAGLTSSQKLENSAFMCDEEMDLNGIPSPIQKQINPKAKMNITQPLTQQPNFSLYQNMEKHSTFLNMLSPQSTENTELGTRNDDYSSFISPNSQLNTKQITKSTKPNVEVIDLSDDHIQTHSPSNSTAMISNHFQASTRNPYLSNELGLSTLPKSLLGNEVESTNPYLKSYNIKSSSKWKKQRAIKKRSIPNKKKPFLLAKNIPIANKNISESNIGDLSEVKIPVAQSQESTEEENMSPTSGAKIMMSLASSKETFPTPIRMTPMSNSLEKDVNPNKMGDIEKLLCAEKILEAKSLEDKNKNHDGNLINYDPSASLEKIPLNVIEASASNETDYAAALPQLPVEPEYNESSEKKIGSSTGNGQSASLYGDSSLMPKDSLKVYEPTIFSIPLASEKPNSSTSNDTWWPSDSAIKNEHILQENYEDSTMDIDDKTFDTVRAKKRHRQSDINSEAGYLEKIPHCKLHKKKSNANGESELLFCVQATDLFPNEALVCCSMCHTWRHACCGGHYSSDGSKLSRLNKEFTPICEICYKENKILSENSKLHKSIERQRSEHLRRTLMMNQVTRQASYSKHADGGKWPLGSVTHSQIGGHVRSVHTKYERAEKEWNEMAQRLGRNGIVSRSKDRAKFRIKEMESIMKYIEDAECSTDRHNMLLFLDRDTHKVNPVGYETQLKNIFDPADDDESNEDEESDEAENDLSSEDKSSCHSKSSAGRQNSNRSHSNKVVDTYSEGKIQFEFDNNCPFKSDVRKSDQNSTDTNSNPSPSMPSKEGPTSKESIKRRTFCERPGCDKQHRFDSLFCSDACGVCVLETDLMRTIAYTQQLNPSLLRSDKVQE